MRTKPSASAWCHGSHPWATSSTPPTRRRSASVCYSRIGVELTKRLLWSRLEASLHAHMDYEGTAQLYARLTTENFEEAVRARREKRSPVFRD